MTAEQSIQPAVKIPWPRAALLAASATYWPQLLMCFYTLGFVACSHCKQAVWQVAPIAPGLFFYEWSRRIFGLPHFSSGVGITLVIVFSLLIFGGLTAWLRYAGRWCIPVLMLVTLASSFLAVGLLSAIRM